MFSRCFMDFSVGVGAFVIGLSRISSFFSYIIHGHDIDDYKRFNAHTSYIYWNIHFNQSQIFTF